MSTIISSYSRRNYFVYFGEDVYVYDEYIVPGHKKYFLGEIDGKPSVANSRSEIKFLSSLDEVKDFVDDFIRSIVEDEVILSMKEDPENKGIFHLWTTYRDDQMRFLERQRIFTAAIDNDYHHILESEAP